MKSTWVCGADVASLNILSQDWCLDGTFSGGSWVAGLPLTNLIIQQPKKIARSSDALTSSTQFRMNFGRIAPVSMFALIAHNLSIDATIRFRLSVNSDLSSPVIDVTINAISTNVIWGSQPWGAFPWTGILSDDAPGGAISFYKHTSTEFGQYVGIDITDTGNADGYVQAGVFKVGDAFVPEINIAYGAGLSFIDPSRQSRTVGGAKYTDVKPRYRSFAAQFEFLTETEAYGQIYDMERLLGISGGLLLVYNPDDDETVLLRRTIFGTLTRLDKIVTARVMNDLPSYSWTFEVEELV